MASGWIVRRGEMESQPLSHERLIAYADSRRLRRTDMVRREDEEGWHKAEEIPGLFISRLPSGLATMAVAAALSIAVTAAVRALGPRLWFGGFHGLVYGLWYGGLLLGYDPSGYGGIMAIAALGSRFDHWLPWVLLLEYSRGWIRFIFLPLWVPGTLLLAAPGLLRPRRYSAGAIIKSIVRFTQLEPAPP